MARLTRRALTGGADDNWDTHIPQTPSCGSDA